MKATLTFFGGKVHFSLRYVGQKFLTTTSTTASPPRTFHNSPVTPLSVIRSRPRISRAAAAAVDLLGRLKLLNKSDVSIHSIGEIQGERQQSPLSSQIHSSSPTFSYNITPRQNVIFTHIVTVRTAAVSAPLRCTCISDPLSPRRSPNRTPAAPLPAPRSAPSVSCSR